MGVLVFTVNILLFAYHWDKPVWKNGGMIDPNTDNSRFSDRIKPY